MRDLEELAAHIAEESEQNAFLVETRIHESARLLYLLPGAGRPGCVSGTRELVVLRTPYLLVDFGMGQQQPVVTKWTEQTATSQRAVFSSEHVKPSILQSPLNSLKACVKLTLPTLLINSAKSLHLS